MAVVFSALSMQAQRTISGTVVEGDTQESVIQATVTLLKSDSSTVRNAVTNMNGQFSLTAPSDGKYIVRVTYVGYKPLYKNITMAGKAINMGKLTINPDAVMLKGATITSHLAKVQSKGDTLIFNADAYRTPEALWSRSW